MATPHSTPTRGLTPKFIEALQPTAKPYDVPDRRAPGLKVRVFPSGVRSFRWTCNARGKVYTIGPWAFSETPGFVTLAQAREWLDKLKAGHAGDAVEAVEAELRAFLRRRSHVADPAPADRTIFRTVAEEFYVDDIQKNRKHPEDVRRILDTDVLPVLGARPTDEITTLECRDVVKRAIARGATVQAGKVLAILKQTFTWAQAQGYTERDPAKPLKDRHLGVESNISDRFLSADEIAQLCRALDESVEADRPEHRKIKPATAAALQLLLVTGVRSGELLKARWEHVDLDGKTWTIPVANQKLTKRQERRAKPFVIPLPPLAVELFRVLQDHAERVLDDGGRKRSPWVMASDDSSSGRYTDKALGRAMRRLFEGKAPRLAFVGEQPTPHDLRRTVRTHLGDTLGVPPHIAERCLNHSLGTIVKTYDRGDYIEQRREALEKWNAFLRRLLAPEQSNVAFLPSAESAS